MVNLPFHEFGHILFRPLGRLMTSLGGSIAQVLMPVICLMAIFHPALKKMNLQQLAVVNDLEALAQILPYLGSEDAAPIGAEGGNRSTKAPMAVLCPGTGLGIAGLKTKGEEPAAALRYPLS